MSRQVVWAVAAVVVAITAFHLQCAVAKTTYVVGDSLGWTVPPGGAAVYSSWASNHSFIVGDVLLFNFTTGEHDVAQVTKAGYDACDENGRTIGSIQNTGPASITLSSAGQNYFICTYNSHCSLGQMLAINVTTTSTPATAPANSAAPPGPATPPVTVAVPPLSATPPATLAVPPLAAAPRISPVVPPVSSTSSQSNETYAVGDSLGWTVPPGGAAAYTTWVAGKTFLVGDTLFFNFTTGKHTVAAVTKAGFDSCSNSSINGSIITTGPAKVVLEAEGKHYYICTITRHCQLGQKLALNVTAGTTSPSPSPSSSSSPSPPSSTPSSSSSPSRVGVTTFSVTLMTTTILVAFFL
ncbi:uclacyanin 1-like [Telopea speciosissima]|uniref:uclacyanin 1-like n=1 Tax=Telopea speciosissima TaxID=54955 RepID=UPI001CC5FF45|nr:uclacyanin 1-like [Telopea speciosissima]